MAAISFKLNHKKSTSSAHITNYNAKVIDHEKNILSIAQPTFQPSFSLANKYVLNILNQGQLGSCVANSFAGIINSIYNISPSRIYYYFNASIQQGNSIGEDNGLDLFQAITSFKNYGIVQETFYPYVITNFSTFPALNIYKLADTTKPFTTTYISQSIPSIQNSLFTGNFVMCGIIVYDSFMTPQVAKTGIIPNPNIKTERVQGGHCVHLVGWSTIGDKLYFIGRNSWGTSWGNNGNPISVASFNYSNNGKNGGFFYISSDYIVNPNLAFEFVAISK